VVTPHEQLGMCCGLPREDISDLNVGDLRRHSMVSLFDQHVHDVMKIWLAVEGPERMLAWAASKDPTIEWEDRYAHTCDACRALYSDSRVIAAIRDHGPEKIDAVLSLFAARDERVMAADGANRTNQLVADSAGAVPSIEPSGKRSERFIPLTAV
jgi:hypothetical protein